MPTGYPLNRIALANTGVEAARPTTIEVAAMQRICRITVPGLSIERDFEAARRRVLGEFPDVHEVIATTAPATLLVLYSGADEADAWLVALLESVAARQAKAISRPLRWRGGRGGGDDSAAWIVGCSP